jgi:putative redox protein
MSESNRALGSAHATSGEGYEQLIRLGRHELLADEPEARGGKDKGPNPFSLVLAGLATCTGITLQMYAKRHGWTLGALRVDVKGFVEEEQYRIRRVLTFPAEVPEEQRVRLAEIAEKTPVTRALRSGFAIETITADK